MPYIRKYPGLVKGFIRRFWNKSADHRGTKAYHGLVVSLSVSCEVDSVVVGIVYEIAEGNIKETVEYLDIREKYGYVRHVTSVFSPVDYAVHWEVFCLLRITG